MMVENLIDHPIDLTTIKECDSFLQWVNGDISNAFYLGFMRREFSEQIEELSEGEDGKGLELLKSIDGAAIKAKPYLNELARLMKPFLESKEGFVILDMINDVLGKVTPKEGEDIFNIAYTLGIYTDYLYNTQAEA